MRVLWPLPRRQEPQPLRAARRRPRRAAANAAGHRASALQEGLKRERRGRVGRARALLREHAARVRPAAREDGGERDIARRKVCVAARPQAGGLAGVERGGGGHVAEQRETDALNSALPYMYNDYIRWLINFFF